MEASSSSTMEGSVYVETETGWKIVLLKLSGAKLSGYTKVAKGKGAYGLTETLSITLTRKCICTETNIRPQIQAKLVAAAILPATPHIFKVSTSDGKFVMAVEGNSLRNKWVMAIKNVIEKQHQSAKKVRDLGASGGDEGNDGRDGMEMTENPMASPQSKSVGNTKAKTTLAAGVLVKAQIEARELRVAQPRHVTRRTIDARNVQKFVESKKLVYGYDNLNDEDGAYAWVPCKLDNLVRLAKIVLGFPFVLVVATLTLSGNFAFLRSVFMIRMMNLSIYLLAPFFVDYILADANTFWQRVAIGGYCSIYLVPVISVIAHKISVQTSKDVVDGSTFCFKPARRMRWSMANIFMLSGFVVDWIQHCLYVLPLGVVTEEKATTLEELPPYLSFTFYFYTAFLSIIICGLIVILNAALRGKAQYSFNRNWILWLFYFNIGGSYFVSIVTIMFMGLWCDSEDPNFDYPVLVQSADIKCWEGDIFGGSFNHRKMAYCAMLGLAFFLVQMTLLPSGTFKETMTDTALDVVFVPVYLQMHMFLKAVFSGIYVLFYTTQYSRVVSLTLVNLLQLVLNHAMKPCSIPLINVWRDITYLTSLLSGVQSLNYVIFNHTNSEVKALYVSTLLTNIFICTVGVLVYHYNTARSADYIIARAFLDLEWQVTRGYNVVNPRVLEPLIALTLSDLDKDRKVASDHIDQMVWLISYPNIRVQFQSVWGLANVSIFDESVRMKVHEAGCTATLFELFDNMDFMVQLEALASLANLSRSHHVSRYMVKHHNAIHFFLSLARGSRTRHADFAVVALGNICRYPDFTDRLIEQGGVPVLVGCFMSSDYGKKRSACRALANISLVTKPVVELALSSRGLLQRIVKFAIRNEVETQLEVCLLLRSLICRPTIRLQLMSLKVNKCIEYFALSTIPQVQLYSDDMYSIMEFEMGLTHRAAGQFDENYLTELSPIDGMIDWNSWGSKLDSIFAPIFNAVPLLAGQACSVVSGKKLAIDLSVGISREMLQDYRDGMVFYILERTLNGELVENEEHSESHMVNYVSDRGFVGTDYFVYSIVMGGLQSPPTTVTLQVQEDPSYHGPVHGSRDLEMGRQNRRGGSAAADGAPAEEMKDGGPDDNDDVTINSRKNSMKGFAQANLRKGSGFDAGPGLGMSTETGLRGNMRQSRRVKQGGR
jgi:hypothetical protein